ncbi:MAG: glutamate racemase [Bacteroidota bacterium]|nr:glutamate racemase [Bacteroidota bacterium]
MHETICFGGLFYFYTMLDADKSIGIFDSGLGGLSVWKYVAEFLPRESFIYFGDSKHAPYGNKSDAFITERCHHITRFLLDENVKLIIVACNTATAAAIESLRENYPHIQFVGMEPAIKPASLLSKTGHIGVLATHGTFKGELFKRNQEKYQPYVKIHYTEGNGLVELAEQGKVYSDEAEKLLRKYIEPLVENRVDQLVLGCTHYSLFIPVIEKITKGAIHILHPADAIAKRTKDLLMQHRILQTRKNHGENAFYSNGKTSNMLDVINQLDVEAEPNIFSVDN